MKTYENFTPGGLHFHLSYEDGVCCIILSDIYDCTLTIKYFTNLNKALRFTNNL